MPTWNPGQYLRFAEERTQPCRDLAARVAVASPKRVIDLGCGPGNSAKVLASRWPDAEITGLDSSAEMIEAARKDQPGRQWIAGNIIDWAASGGEQFDVVFSNAALQWLPDHAALYPKLLSHVSPGGALAVQVPGNWDAPPHRLLRKIAASPVPEWHVHDVEFYYDAVAPHATRVDLWTTEYLHIMPDIESIGEWYKGSGMRPYLDAIGSAEERERFMAEYLTGLRMFYTPRLNGSVLFPFRRIFLIAYC